MNISKTVTLKEATQSQTATRNNIDNSPNAEQLENMKRTAEHIIDRVRERYPDAIVSSFFRSLELNTAIGGSSKTSQHMTGEAVDLDSKDNDSNNEIFSFIKTNLVFDQLIGEYPDKNGEWSWVHASYVEHPKKNRAQILVKLKDKYIPFGEYKIGMV